MFNAQYLFANDIVFSPWMSREGDSVLITLDLVGASVDPGTADILKVELYTKNTEDPGDGDLVTSGNITVTGNNLGRTRLEFQNNLDELVRYRFSCLSTKAAEYALFRMLSPVWFNDVKA